MPGAISTREGVSVSWIPFETELVEALRLTTPVKLFRLETVRRELAELPTVTVRREVLPEREKSGRRSTAPK